MSGNPSLDLVVLVPGKDDREAVEGLLRPGRRALHPRDPVRSSGSPAGDPGCYHEAPDILQTYQRRAMRALVILDYEGSGQEHLSPREVAAELKRRLARSGWGDRAERLISR